MKFAFRTNNNDNDLVNEFIEKLLSLGYRLDNDNPDYVFVFGGDGTVIRAIHDFEDKLAKLIFIGINFGNLGFYTDFTKNNLDLLIDVLNNNKYQIIELPLISYLLKDKTTPNALPIEGYALNEVTIINPEKTIVMDVYINGEKFESFRGTGMAISTPSGSTAYNKSLGGAILDINLKAMQMTEIASINNRIYKTIGSPIVFDEHSYIELYPQNYDGCVFTCDNKIETLEHLDYLKVQVAKKAVKLLTIANRSFYSRVKYAFIGSSDD